MNFATHMIYFYLRGTQEDSEGNLTRLILAGKPDKSQKA